MRIAGMLGAVVLAGSIVVGPTVPAVAHTDACAIPGALSTNAGFHYPGIAYSEANFTVSGSGLCTSNFSVSASGAVYGYCGLSTAEGTTYDGHAFSWIDIGGVAVLFRELQGVLTLTQNILAGEVCHSPAGASSFIVFGSFSLFHGL